MNIVLRLYLERRLERLQRAELRRTCEEAREAQAKLAPLLQRRREQEKARRRQDGPSGFVMVDKEW